MQERLIVVQEPADRQAIGQLATIAWESRLLPVLAVTVADENGAALAALAGVVRLEDPKVGRTQR